MNRKGKDIAASARQRLLNLAKERGENFDLVLTRYGLERLLYRLSRSRFADQFILKGAMLFLLWSDDPHRVTRDVDLLGHGDNSPDHLVKVFREIVSETVDDDGLVFDGDSIRAETIAEEAEYDGIRVQLKAVLSGANISLQVDIGFGDVVTPDAERTEYPTLLEFPAPVLRTYPRETVIAEKYQAMVMLGIANSRMKDFYDIWVLARDFDFDGELLCQAIRATFERRKTQLPDTEPLAFTSEFYDDRQKQTQWQAFINKSGLTEESVALDQVIDTLRRFLMPPTKALNDGKVFGVHWQADGNW